MSTNIRRTTINSHREIGNTIFEPGKEGSHYTGGGSSSGDKEEQAKDTAKKDTDQKDGSKN